MWHFRLWCWCRCQQMKERTPKVDGGKEMRASDCYHGYLVQQLCGLCKPARWGRPTLWSAFFYFLLSRWVHTCWVPLVDGLWQPIRSYEEFFLLSTTSTCCNAEIAIWHGRMFQSRWLKLMLLSVIWTDPESFFFLKKMDEFVANWWLFQIPILFFPILIFIFDLWVISLFATTNLHEDGNPFRPRIF
jgi:hypothetical protein